MVLIFWQSVHVTLSYSGVEKKIQDKVLQKSKIIEHLEVLFDNLIPVSTLFFLLILLRNGGKARY